MKKITVFLLLLSLPLAAMAHNLGQQGATFTIVEPDLLLALKARAKVLGKSGYFPKLQNALRQQATHNAERPEPVSGITTTIEAKSWLYDPSIVMPQNVYSPRGVLIVKAGQRYNPLQAISFNQVLLFYNSDDPREVAWAQAEDLKYKNSDKLILVNGSVTAQRQLFQKAIYFDQQGRLTTRFHIRHVPAMVAQFGLRLKIREVLL